METMRALSPKQQVALADIRARGVAYGPSAALPWRTVRALERAGLVTVTVQVVERWQGHGLFGRNGQRKRAYAEFAVRPV